MKIGILLTCLWVLCGGCWAITSNSTEVKLSQEDHQMDVPLVEFKEMVGSAMSNLWSWVVNRGKTEDNFIGRCFGVARKLKMLMPVIIFMLGVILTTLAFLTIFSLKGLGLLVTLLVMNTTGWATKLALAKHEIPHHAMSPPQNVHFHVHQDKDGHVSNVGHSGYDSHGWYDRSSPGSSYLDMGDDISSEENLYNRLKKLNVYSRSYT